MARASVPAALWAEFYEAVQIVDSGMKKRGISGIVIRCNGFENYAKELDAKKKTDGVV